jgi:hypothetical protein
LQLALCCAQKVSDLCCVWKVFSKHTQAPLPPPSFPFLSPPLSSPLPLPPQGPGSVAHLLKAQGLVQSLSQWIECSPVFCLVYPKRTQAPLPNPQPTASLPPKHTHTQGPGSVAHLLKAQGLVQSLSVGMGDEVRLGRGWMFWGATLTLTGQGEDQVEHVLATLMRGVQVRGCTVHDCRAGRSSRCI